MEPTRDEGFIVNEGILGVIGVCNRRIEFLSVQQRPFEQGWKIVLLFPFGAHFSAASQKRACAATCLLRKNFRKNSSSQDKGSTEPRATVGQRIFDNRTSSEPR